MATIDLRLALPDPVVGDNPTKIRCLNQAHDDPEKSLAVYADHLHCYGCGLHIGNGNCQEGPDCPSCQQAQLDALMLLLGRLVQKDELATFATEGVPSRHGEAQAPLPYGLALAYHEVLYTARAGALPWLQARGLDNHGIALGLLGHNGFQYTIPVWDADKNLVTIRFRRDDTYSTRRAKYVGLPGRNGLHLYPEWLLAHSERDWVVVCEGELDALRLWQEDIPAVSGTNGAGQVAKVVRLLKEKLPWVQHVVIATDRDGPGEEAALAGIRAANDCGFSAERLRWEVGKDVTEALQLGGLTSEAIRQSGDRHVGRERGHAA